MLAVERYITAYILTYKEFYELAEHVPDSEIDPEIGEKLDAIVGVSEGTLTRGEG